MAIYAEEEELVAAFTEWDRRYREDPEGFENEAARLLKGTPQSYGEAAAPYFVSILQQLGEEAEVSPPPVQQ